VSAERPNYEYVAITHLFHACVGDTVHSMEETHQKSKIAKMAAEKRGNAERSRRYRESRAEKGVPVARDVDAAWSEASSYWMARRGATAPLHPIEIMKTTRIILEREGFEPKAAATAIAVRLASRTQHMMPDHVPSLKLGAIEYIRETRTGPWRTPMSVIVALFGREQP